jgi:hypothetical protein
MEGWNPESRAESILVATIDGEEYTSLPQSRLEYLLLQLKDVIEQGGGGGGGTTNYNALTNKPQINNVTLSGNKTASDLSLLGTNDSLTEAQMTALKALLN